MGKTYLCGKIGKSVKFNPNSWSAIGGDNEAPKLIKEMAVLNPYDTFIIISKSDYQKSKSKGVQLPKNLYDVYDGASKKEKNDLNYINKRLENIKIDGCFLMTGPSGTTNIPDRLYRRKELKNGQQIFAKSLECFQNYVGPMYHFLNESMIPWVMIANDPRYIQQGNDLLNLPVKILSQFDETVELKCVNNFKDQYITRTNVQANYTQMEKMFLIGQEHPRKYIDVLKSKKFMMVLNQGGNGVKSRYDDLKKYVLDFIDDVQIYGKWDDDIIQKDKRFKGSKKFIDLQEDLPSVKYTLIIPIKPGWVTSKWVEMISYGIIPFFHPDYDTQRHLKVPEFLRIPAAKILYERIEILENDPQAYQRLLHECIDCIKESDLDGSNLSNIILKNTPPVDKNGEEFEAQETQITLNTFDEW